MTAPAKVKTITTVIAVLGITASLAAGALISSVGNTLVVLGFVGVAAFIAIFLRLEVGAAIMVILLYSQAYIIVGERYGVTDVVQWLLLLMIFSMGTRWFIYPQEIPQGWMLPAIAIFFYCMVGLASTIYATDSGTAWYIGNETMKSGTIALILALILKNESSFRVAIWALLGVGIFLGSLSIFQFATGNYSNDFGGYAVAAIQNISGTSDDYRLGGPVGDPNYYAQMMLVLVPIALDRLWNEKTTVLRLLAAWALGVCAFTVILTYSRGGFLAMMAVVVVMIAIFHRGQLRYLMLAGVLGLLMINFLPAQFSQRLSTLTELLPSDENPSGTGDYSFRGRTSEMLVALQMFADYPVLGVGLGNYPVLYQKYAQRIGLEMRAEVRQAHSLYLEVASETGLLGLFSFGLLLWVIFKSTWRAQRNLEKDGLTSTSNIIAAYGFGFLGYLIAATFIHAAYPRNFWVLAGIALSIPRIAEIERAAAESIKSKLASFVQSTTSQKGQD